MRLGISISNFSWPVPVSGLGPMVSRIARTADDAGVDSLWVMDHFFQIRLTGLPPRITDARGVRDAGVPGRADPAGSGWAHSSRPWRTATPVS